MKQRINITLEPEELEALDKARGLASRSAWIRTAIKNEITYINDFNFNEENEDMLKSFCRTMADEFNKLSDDKKEGGE